MNSAASAGYSGTPLARKLGYKPAARVFVSGAPAGFHDWLDPLPAGVVFEALPGKCTDMAHIFVSDRATLALELAAMRQQLKPDAALWVSWPKKSSGVPSTVTQDTIRELALALGFVDVKVCAVTQTWSGLKLVLRKELRR